MPESRPDASLHVLLTGLLQPRPVTRPSQDQQAELIPTPTTPSLHQQVLQQSQAQHHALHWLIKICADVALGTSLLLPENSQASSSSDADVNSKILVDRWVLLGRLLGFLDGYTHMLTFTLDEVVPGHKQRRAPKMVKDILLHLTAVADVVGQAQRWA